MMSSSVAMEILCITNIGSISSKKRAGFEKLLLKCQIVIFFIENLQKYLKCTGKHSVKGLVNLQKTFFTLILIEKPVMRETEWQKPHQKIQNSYRVMKVSKFN